MQLLPNAAAAGGISDIDGHRPDIIEHCWKAARAIPAVRPAIGHMALSRAASRQLRPPKSRRRGLANEAGMRGARVAYLSLPSSCISAAAAGTSAVHPASCNQEEKEARIIQQLWFNFRPALHVGYGRRIAGFGITYFLILALCALLGSWLSDGMPEVWAGFAGPCLITLAILTLTFIYAFRKRSAEHQDLLDRFHGKSELLQRP
ncbi:MAG: hypothetical protein DUD39_17430 [Coriobacteriaceae bacterium]|nr:MAG: hypothetical protein DUD39_17430 [Coriobacteriaceae bacterium]